MLWVTALVFGWALRPISDTVPVVVNPTSELAVELAENPSATPEDAPRAQLVMCNSPVDGSPATSPNRFRSSAPTTYTTASRATDRTQVLASLAS